MAEQIDAEGMLAALRRKEGNWVEWGRMLQQLQTAGRDVQGIFEATGFEPFRQNQFIVASQVYASLETSGGSPELLEHFARGGAPALYELRVLTGPDRVAAAGLVRERNLDPDGARELTKAMKDFALFNPKPEGFSNHPGDAYAYRCWKLAQQTEDLRERSRLIAQGLAFAHGESARRKIEQLLYRTAEQPRAKAPNLPIFRFEVGEELPRVLPVIGALPLDEATFRSAPFIEERAPFGVVEGSGAWVALPGWQTIRAAEDAVVISANTTQLPGASTASEDVLIVVDRALRDWNALSYFLVAEEGKLILRWFPESPEVRLYGQVVVILRPKRLLDEEMSKDVWQLDE